MSQQFQKTTPSFLEAGLPCASLSAESQRDNNARQRPPQNRLHIWWARRPPTISRAAILAGLLSHDLQLDKSVLPPMVDEPSTEDLENLPPKLQEHRAFFERLLDEVKPTQLTTMHQNFLQAMGITGDAAAAYKRMSLRDEESKNGFRIPLPDALVYRHPSAFGVSPSSELLRELLCSSRAMMQLANEPLVVLDSMAGGGVIPLEAVRYGAKVYANDLNPVASLVLKATVEYPAKFGRCLLGHLERLSRQVNDAVRNRLSKFCSTETAATWWSAIDQKAIERLRSRQVVALEPGGDAVTRDYLWLHTVPCSKCDLNIPISTNFLIVSKKGKPEANIAAFPVVPRYGQSNDCAFRIVPRAEWKDCIWPCPGFERWDPRDTPTFKDGHAICPRCGQLIDSNDVKSIARSRAGGLAAQMYSVCSQVPVKLTYRNGDVKVRSLWRFRAPTQADLDAVRAAEEELARLRPRWEVQDLIPTEEIPEGEKTKEPCNMNFRRWRDFFLPRQLLTNIVILEEIRAAQARARAELPEAEAEAVSVYLAFILSKVVNYNSVNAFWHYGRLTVAQTFSRHDFAFRPAFCAGFEIRSSAPIHTEAESSLNIRGLDAARSTVLLLCLPREEIEQPVGNWGTVQNRIARVARGAAERFQKQGLTGTDLYLSALGPALGEVGRNWPVTDFAGRQIDLAEALDEAYKAVGRWRLDHIFADLKLTADLTDVEEGFSVDAVDRDSQTLWLWLDTFQGETAHSDDVRKLAKSLNVDTNDFKRMGLLSTEKETFALRPPQTVDLRLLARRLRGEDAPRGRAAREADVWEERMFPCFVGAAAWNAIALMMGADGEHRGVDAVRRWLRESGYGTQREFRGAFAVTLHLLELVFSHRPEGNEWHEAARQARRTWDLVLHSWQT